MYLPAGGTTPTISPAFVSSSFMTPAPIRADMAVTKQDTALATRNETTSFGGTIKYGCAQFVGPSMSAQTIAGTFILVVKCAQVNLHDYSGNANMTDPFFFVDIRVFSSANVQRGTLISTTFTSSPTAGNPGQTWATTLETRIVPTQAFTSLAVSDGDRLVVTIGAKVDDTQNSERLSLVFGDPSATADHTLVAGQTMVGVPWIEFSGDLFGAAVPVTLAASGTVAAVATASGDPTAVTSAQTLPATGTTTAVTACTGNAARVLLVLAASGTAAVVAATAGDATRTPLVLAAAGTTAATTATAGNPTRVLLTLAASGTTPATSTTAGDATVVGGPGAASGTITATTTVIGNATRVTLTLAASGTIPVVATSSGDPTRVTLTLAVSGTVTAASTVAGDPTMRVRLVLAASGTVDVISATLGAATRQWVTLAASGTITAVTFTSGAVFNTSSQVDITATATLLPRRWGGTLQNRRWEAHL